MATFVMITTVYTLMSVLCHRQILYLFFISFVDRNLIWNDCIGYVVEQLPEISRRNVRGHYRFSRSD